MLDASIRGAGSMAEVNPRPNVAMIMALEAAQDAAHAVRIFLEMGVPAWDICEAVVSYVFRLASSSTNDRACRLEFCLRHGGLASWDTAQRMVGFAQTNRCSQCRRIGHQARHCPF